MNIMKGKKDCYLCHGSGLMNVPLGREDTTKEDCFCTIAYKAKVKQIV